MTNGLRLGAGASSAFARSRLRTGLVIGELALSVLLLTGAGLLLRSFTKLIQLDPGFRTEGLLALEVSLPLANYREPARMLAFADRAREELRSLPGVIDAGLARTLPLAGDLPYVPFTIAGDPPLPVGEKILGDYQVCDGAFFSAMGIRLLRGRAFEARDAFGTTPVIMINDALARRHFPSRDPIGRQIVIGFGGPPRTIVGVVSDVRRRSLELAARPEMYVPFEQAPIPLLTFVLRTEDDSATPAAAARERIRELDRNLPVFAVRTMEQVLHESLAGRRIALWLLSLFAAIGVAIASVGVYGVMAYVTAQRSREIGIRLAIGARRTEIGRMILGRALFLAAVGIAAGLACAVPLTQQVRTMLFAVTPLDPLVIAGVSALLVAVAVLACAVPALRAMRLDPAVTLRHD